MNIYSPEIAIPDYSYPSPDLLNDHKGTKVDEDIINENKDRIKEVLHHYGVSIDELNVTIGPTLLIFEFHPPANAQISKIRKTEDDIAVALGVEGIRIIAPIPGRGTVGIEVPNPTPSIVGMKNIISSKKFNENDMELPVVLGKDAYGDNEIADLSKMPHLLMAGATGQGKSVTLNVIINSLLYKIHPSRLKFVFIDPKRVELTMYKELENHFLCEYGENKSSVVSDTNEALSVLSRLNEIMEERYEMLENAKVRSVQEYNKKWRNEELGSEYEYLPYIVVAIDEFADLIMTSGKEMEEKIIRLAQKARAIGIHLIVATQRPSSEVITGLIKANFPSRIAFRTSSRVDSRTILDEGGAEQLVGKGDMLFSYGTKTKRLQSPLIETDEIDGIMEHIKNQDSFGEGYKIYG